MGERRQGLRNVPVGVWRRTIELARELRKAPTHGEMILWSALRARRFNGVRFRRQHPIGPYVVDFYAPAVGLAIEIDGPCHKGREARDCARQLFLESQRVRFVRLSADFVENDLDGCLARIRQAFAQS